MQYPNDSYYFYARIRQVIVGVLLVVASYNTHDEMPSTITYAPGTLYIYVHLQWVRNSACNKIKLALLAGSKSLGGR